MLVLTYLRFTCNVVVTSVMHLEQGLIVSGALHVR